MHTSLGVGTLSVAEIIGSKLSPGVCVILHVNRTVTPQMGENTQV